ncbi:MAG: XRE family transcriptional regulator [Candidatus Poribacteria bacterium]
MLADNETHAERIGTRIKQARHMRQMNQRRLADGVGMSAQTISHYERGIHTPDSETLVNLAEALDVRMDALLRPIRVESIEPVRPCRSRLGAKPLRAVKAAATDWLERYMTVERILYGQPGTLEWPARFPYSVRCVGEAEGAATALRNAWDLGLSVIENVTHVIEDHGVKVCDLADHVDLDPWAFHACGEQKTPFILMGRGADSPAQRERQRFLLARELGLLATKCKFPLIDDDHEDVATRFADAFLVPKAWAREELGEKRKNIEWWELHALQRKHGLTAQGWLRRARDLGIVSSNALQRMGNLLEGGRDIEPGRPRETPERLERLVYHAYAEDIIGDGRASELLDIDRGEFLRQIQEETPLSVASANVCH